MKIILHSEYLTVEYLIWRMCNFSDSFSEKLEENFYNDMKVIILPVNSRNLLSKVKIGQKIYIFKQYGKPEPSKFLENESNIYDLNILGNISTEKIFYDHGYGIIVTEKLLGFDPIMQILYLILPLGNWEKVSNIISLSASIFRQLHQSKIDSSLMLKPDSVSILKKVDSHSNQLLIDDINFFEREWKQEDFIHFDLRLDNMLIKDTEIKIIDWEMAIIGDYYWDLAIFLNSLVLFLGTVEIYTLSTHFRLERIRSVVKEFIKTYFSQKEDEPDLNKLRVYWRLQNFALYDSEIYINRINDFL
ncbi:phosphotransferase [Emticicia sp. SJ17W-69]|uniref:phosphotransferase n=1 Tax=Emticicia sp. SJ17W-69 TaxID=3421657 RepID=UPI003EB8AED8